MASESEGCARMWHCCQPAVGPWASCHPLWTLLPAAEPEGWTSFLWHLLALKFSRSPNCLKKEGELLQQRKEMSFWFRIPTIYKPRNLPTCSSFASLLFLCLLIMQRLRRSHNLSGDSPMVPTLFAQSSAYVPSIPLFCAQEGMTSGSGTTMPTKKACSPTKENKSRQKHLLLLCCIYIIFHLRTFLKFWYRYKIKILVLQDTPITKIKQLPKLTKAFLSHKSPYIFSLDLLK